MNVTETASQGLKREFKVVVNAAQLARQAEERLAEMAPKAQIKGFRPGKVPVAHLKRLYGKSVMAEVVQKAIDDGARSVFADRNLKPAYQPEVKLPEAADEVEQIMDGKKDLSFDVSAEVIPEFQVKDHAGLTLTKHVVSVTDAHLDEAVNRLASGSKSWESKGGNAKSEKGDRVTISFVGKVDGKAFDGGAGENIPLELGSNQFIPGFEDQLIGKKTGEDVLVKVTFPDTYGVAELAGKAAEFDTRIASIDAPKAAVVDDEFAKRMGFESLSALRDMLKGGIEREFGRMTQMKLKRDVLDALDKEYTFELPEKLVEAEFNGIWNALQNEMQRAGKSFADENTTEDEARKEYRAIAERRVRLGLVLGTLGEKENVQVNEQELQQALIARVRQFPGQEKQVYDYYRKNPSALIELRGPIFEQKVVDLIVGKASVTDKETSREDLQKMVEEDLDDEA
ncbi:MAG: trigger factor [Rhizobiales bacterium]|nr:trigger factor [Hyphomicrobiales bacterium]